MKRSSTDSNDHDRLFKFGRPSTALERILTLVGLISLFLIFTVIGHRNDTEIEAKNLIGPLASYVVLPSTQDLAPCRDQSCTFAVSHPETATAGALYSARYLAPEIRIIKAPPGKVFRSSSSCPFTWVTYQAMQTKANTLACLFKANGTEGVAASDPGEPMDMSTPGYVRAAVTAASGERVLLNGMISKTDPGTASERKRRSEVPPLAPNQYAGASGQAQLHRDNPAFSSLEFQPVETTMSFEIADSAGSSLAIGNPGILYFKSASEINPATLKANTSNETLAGTPVQIIGITPTKSGSGLIVQTKLATDTSSQDLLKRIKYEQERNQSAFPEHVVLDFSPRHNIAPEKLVRVPNSAIAHDDKGSFVWLDISGLAIPVRVKEIERADQYSIITEQAGGARGLPLLPEQWRTLDAYARSQVFQAAQTGEDQKSNKLVNSSAHLINLASDKIRAGLRIRTSDAH